MNKRFAIFAAGFLLLGATFAQIRQKNIVDEVIWVVGDNPILLSDVEDYRVNAEAEGQVFKDPYAQIPEQIAIQKLFLHQAEPIHYGDQMSTLPIPQLWTTRLIHRCTSLTMQHKP